jgi:hypothetical protein
MVPRTYTFASLVFAGTFALFCMPLSAFAQTQSPSFGVYQTDVVPGGDTAIGDFVVGPGKIDLTLAPGETRTVEVLVTNRTGSARRFNLTTEDAAGSHTADTAIILLGDEHGPYSLKDYVSVPYASFELAQSERAHIPVTISIPGDAEPGGLYGSILVDTVAIDAVSADASGTVPQSAIVARIGTLFFITVAGEAERAAELSEFATAPKQRFFQSGPIRFGILHENTGSVHVAPYGELRIHNMFGAEVGYLEIDPWFVLPQSVRLREISWNRDYLFGRYTATVAINRSYDDIVDERSYTFWVLPWKPIALTFVGLFVVFFALRAFFRRFEFKRKDSADVTGAPR